MEPPMKKRRIDIPQEQTLWQWLCTKLWCLKRLTK